jgi:hypothetical protein
MTSRGDRAAFGFSVHTGWAALLAVAGPPRAPRILARRRVEMIAGRDPGEPPFVYHAARGLSLPAAERLVRGAAVESRARATAALEAVLAALRERGVEVAASGIVVAGRSLAADLPAILASHSRIHSAEGELYRDAIRQACEALSIPVRAVRAGELQARAARLLGIDERALPERLAAIGREAGRPWAKDQKDALLAALLAAAD